ncbi:MAG: RelA/SpoT family protein [Candidatus Wolfebacteria bacterium GW2011_GWC1_43_10]|uniref:RelA/SpoT family protein n=1 Tax=Candidatus Wolfebacteria bacterium GW2011_GWC1_43_10 TaxID=1619011 RepID=A0A0G1CAS1_9BACT|nr:MAG: RelA/SpoT family protein [Candidatus Wolfebacteria bacterium GW2011_GWC1_43_10]
MTLEKILKQFNTHFPNDTGGQELIKKAAVFAKNAHKNQKRASQEPYFNHLLETAYKLAEWKLDAATIAAGLLHDTIEDCQIPKDVLEKEFGEEIVFIVDGVTKLGNLKYRGESGGSESLRKMILAVSKDLRVIFVKLADRLHNVKTLHFLPAVKQKRIAAETNEIYAPIAYRLGMQSLAGELEDLTFPHLHPQEYFWLKENVKETYQERERYLKNIEPQVREQLARAGIVPLAMDYRAKRLYSLYKKLIRYEMNMDQIYDLVAFRIILHTIEECYLAMGIIHQVWPPMPGRIKDYIALPKTNGYQSLHTTVFCTNNRPAEFQIRTKEMHEQAEHGAAAHWLYQSTKGTTSYNQKRVFQADSKENIWIRQLKEWQHQFPGSREFVEALKVDFFSDRIFVLTPKGMAVDLPLGSTPVDFAYKIHTRVGDACVGAKVNNKIVPLDWQIQSGDVVEILTQKSKKPSKNWLEFVKTSHAKKKIKAATRVGTPFKKIEFRLACQDRVSLLKDISATFSRNHIRISDVQTKNGGRFPIVRIVADVGIQEKAEEIMIKLRKVEGVREVGYKIRRFAK